MSEPDPKNTYEQKVTIELTSGPHNSVFVRAKFDPKPKNPPVYNSAMLAFVTCMNALKNLAKEVGGKCEIADLGPIKDNDPKEDDDGIITHSD